MFEQVREGKFHQRRHGLSRFQVLQIQLHFLAPHLEITAFEYAHVQNFLALEIVINHAYVNLGSRCNLLNSRTVVPETTKFPAGRLENLILGLGGVAFYRTTLSRTTLGVVALAS